MTGIHHASMREQRTVSNMDSRDSIPHSRSDPADPLETILSDESSVFSGLVYGKNKIIPPPPPPPPPPPKEERPSKSIIQKGILRAAHHTTTTATTSKNMNLAIASSSIDDDNFSVDNHTEFFSSPSSSSLTDRSQRSMMRDMPPIIDSVMSLGSSTFFSTATSNDSTMSNELMKNMENLHDLFPDGDSNTQMTWGSANDMARPKGTIKLMSSVAFVGDQIEVEGSGLEEEDSELEVECTSSELDHHENSQQSITNCKSDASDSRIVDLLNDFEKKMDDNIEIINAENNDENGDIFSDLMDIIPRRVQSEDAESDDLLTPLKARKLQRILHKAKDEVEVLKDNSEQYKSEIEQMEEEHKSEIKLIKDRTKQQLGELKSFYQGEIEGLAVEKDAAIIEAGCVAAKYVQSAKKQQKQIYRLKAAAMVTIKDQVEKAGRDATASKNHEITARVGALRNSYESELEKVKKESDERVKSEVEKAVSSVTKRERSNQDVLVSEVRDQIDDLRREQHSMVDLLESVKSKFEQHYPIEMIQYKEKSDNFSGIARKLLDNNTSSEKLLKEVIGTFTFLLEATEKKAASAQNQSAMQENEKKPPEVVKGGQKHLVLRHRAEIEHLKKEKGETFEKLRKVERDFKDVSREKSLLEYKLQRESENHQMELDRIRLESKTVLDIEMRRKDLEHAMTTGQRELSHQKVTKEEYRFAASFMNVEKRKELDLQVQALNTETKDPLEKELQYSFSIPTPRSISEEDVGLERSDRQKRTFDSPRSPSFRKATSNQSNIIPRETNQIPLSIGVMDTNKSKSNNNNIIIPATDKMHMCQARDTPVIEFAHGTISNMDSKLDASDPSIKSCDSASLSDLQNRMRETEDQVFNIINTMSDGSNNMSKPDNYQEDIDTKSKKAKKNTENPVLGEKKQEDKLAANHPKKNNFAILRKFKGHNNSTEQNSSQATEKEIEDKKETTNIMIRSLRRARNFKKDDSRRSIDASISSLKPNSSEDSTLRESRKDSRVGRLLNARQNYPSAETRDESNQIKNYKKTEAPRSAKKGTDTLGMFAEGRRNFKQPGNNKLQYKSVDSELDSNDEIIIPPPPLPHSSSKYNRNGSNDEVQKGLHEISHVENKDEPFGEITTRLNLKKPPLSTVQELSSMKGSPHSRVYRTPGFASFGHGRFNEETVRKSNSDANSSSLAGSEATTAVTAHTDLSSSNGSVSFTTALKARVRVRKLQI
jgi:hypothetical protein